MKKKLSLALTVILLVSAFPFSAVQLGGSSMNISAAEPTVLEPQDISGLTLSPAVVYLADGGTGDGSSSSSPVGTLTDAFNALPKEDGVITGGTIIITADFTLANELASKTYSYVQGGVTLEAFDGRFFEPEHTGLVIITAENDAKFIMGSWDDHGTAKSLHYILGGDTRFEDVTFSLEYDPVFYGVGHYMIMGSGLAFDGSGTEYKPYLVGYYQNTGMDTEPGDNFYDIKDRNIVTDTHIIVYSGNYNAITGYARTGNFSGGSGKFEGTAYIDMYGGTADNIVGSGYLCYYIEFDTTAKIYMDGGTVTYFHGQSRQSRGCSFGDAFVYLMGGTVTHLQGQSRDSRACTFGDSYVTVDGTSSVNKLNGMSYLDTGCTFGNSVVTVKGGVSSSENAVLGLAREPDKDETATYGYSTYGNAKVSILPTVTHTITYVMGGFMDATVNTRGGNVELNCSSSGTIANASGGSYRSCGYLEDITVNISSGAFNNLVTGASREDRANFGPGSVGNVTVYVTGGTLNGSGGDTAAGAIFGGTWISSTTIRGNITMNLSGGTFGNRIIGLTKESDATCNNIYINLFGNLDNPTRNVVGGCYTSKLNNHYKSTYISISDNAKVGMIYSGNANGSVSVNADTVIKMSGGTSTGIYLGSGTAGCALTGDGTFIYTGGTVTTASKSVRAARAYGTLTMYYGGNVHMYNSSNSLLEDFPVQVNSEAYKFGETAATSFTLSTGSDDTWKTMNVIPLRRSADTDVYVNAASGTALATGTRTDPVNTLISAYYMLSNTGGTIHVDADYDISAADNDSLVKYGSCIGAFNVQLNRYNDSTGFSIRITGDSGIRFKVKADKNMIDNGITLGNTEYSVEGFGTLVKLASNENELIYANSASDGGALRIARSVAYDKVSAARIYAGHNGVGEVAYDDESATDYIYTAILLFGAEDSLYYTTEFTFRSYIILSDGENTVYVYGDEYTRSIGYVANQMVATEGGEYYDAYIADPDNTGGAIPAIVWDAYGVYTAG